MKSIRKFRLTRQALKQAPPAPAQAAPRHPDEQVEFPLGPRLFGKREKRRAEPEENLTIQEHTAAEPLDAEYVPTSAVGRLEPLAPQAEVVKIIPESDWQAAEGQAKAIGAPIPDSSTENAPGQAGQDWPDEAGRGGADPAAGLPETPLDEAPVHSTDDDTFGNQPVVITPDEPGPAEPRTEQAAQQDSHGETGTPPTAEPGKDPRAKDPRVKDSRARTPADRLSRYAVKVGAHSYVLIDDEGHPVRKSGRPKQK